MSRETFAEVWATAENLADQDPRAPEADFLIGVARTCRWLAGVWVPSPFPDQPDRMEMAASPVFGRTVYAMPETIEAEYQAALMVRTMKPENSYVRQTQGAEVTLAWCWRGSKRPPIELPGASEAS